MINSNDFQEACELILMTAQKVSTNSEFGFEAVASFMVSEMEWDGEEEAILEEALRGTVGGELNDLDYLVMESMRGL